MRVRTLLLFLASTLMCFWSLNTADSRTAFVDESRFDTFGNLCWDDEKIRLDAFANELRRSIDVIGYVYVYAGKHSCPGEADYRAGRAAAWLKRRGITSRRLLVRDAGFREEVETDLITASATESKPAFKPNFERRDVSVRRKCVDKIFARVICLNGK